MIDSHQECTGAGIKKHCCNLMEAPEPYSLSVECRNGRWIMTYRALPSRLGDDLSDEIVLSCPVLFCPFCGQDLSESTFAELRQHVRAEFEGVARVIASPAYGGWWLQIYEMPNAQAIFGDHAMQLDPLDQHDTGVALRIRYCPISGRILE